MGFKKKTQNGFRWGPSFTKIQPKPGPGPTRLYIYIVTKIPSCIYSYNPKIIIASPHTLISSVASQVSSLQLTLSYLNLTQFQVSTLNLNSSIQFNSHASPPSSDQDNPRWQAQPQSSVKHLANKPSHHHETLNHRELPLTITDPQLDGFGFCFLFFLFSCFCEQNLGLDFVFVSQICGDFFFLVCFVGGIFKFANFISKFTKFLGFVGFFVQIGLLDLGIRLDTKKMLFCDDLWFRVCIDFFVCDFGPSLTGSDGVGLGATTKNLFIKWAGFG